MENRSDKFRRKHFNFIDRLLIRLATIAVVLLVLVQVLHMHGEARKYLSLVDKLEGEQITSPSTMYAADMPLPDASQPMNTVNKMVAKSLRTLRPGKNITIRMINPPAGVDAIITVNGEVVGNFRKGEVELTVYEGDYIEIDAVRIKQPAQFIINTHSKDLLHPADGIMLENQSNLIVVGKVVFNDHRR